MRNMTCTNNIQIVYEDRDILVINKPAGVLSENSPKGEGGILTLLINDERRELHLLHRLDKEVGGVMVFGKNKKSASALSEAIAKKEFKKTYLAVTDGIPEMPSGIYKDMLFKDSGKNKSFVVDRMRKGVRDASLEYSVLATGDGKALVKVLLHTGRTHQIRVQFSSRKMPLTADRKYGSKEKNGGIALFSHEISFIHPSSKEVVTFSLLPDFSQYPWNLFGGVIIA